MMLNYKRGFQRVYMLLSLAWVLWMLYQPFYERKRATTSPCRRRLATGR